MKVIFLDVDGVLNNSILLYHYGSDFIDEEMTALFAQVVKSTGAKVVLSSSWRLEEVSKKMVEGALAVYGVKIMDSTPSWLIRRRDKEISAWLDSNPRVTKYAILDDNPDAGIGMEENFFKTDPETGLDGFTAEAMIDHLGSIF